MKKILLVLVFAVCLLFACKKENPAISIVGEWHLPFLADTLMFSFDADDTIRHLFMYGGDSLVDATHYNLDNQILTLDSPSYFSLMWSIPKKLKVVELSQHKLNLESFDGHTKMFFHR